MDRHYSQVTRITRLELGELCREHRGGREADKVWARQIWTMQCRRQVRYMLMGRALNNTGTSKTSKIISSDFDSVEEANRKGPLDRGHCKSVSISCTSTTNVPHPRSLFKPVHCMCCPSRNHTGASISSLLCGNPFPRSRDRAAKPTGLPDDVCSLLHRFSTLAQ